MRLSSHSKIHFIAALLALAGALAAPVISAAPAAAMSVSPVYLDMVSVGPRSRGDIRVVNRSERRLPVEAVVSRVTRRPDGTKTIKRDEADFLVLPMQAMIPPGGSQILKVQWLGDPLIDESRAYRISVNQLPVAAPGADTAVQVLMNLTVIVHVAPPEGAPALELVSQSTSRDRSGARVPIVTVRNPSKVHARLSDATIQLSASGWRKVLTPQTLDGLLGIGAVMPGQTRTFQLPVPLPEALQSFQAQFDYSPPSQRSSAQ